MPWREADYVELHGSMTSHEADDAMKEKAKTKAADGKRKPPANAGDDVRLQQTSLRDDDIRALKVHALMQNKRLADVQEDAILEFFQERERFLKDGGIPEKLYNAPPAKSKVNKDPSIKTANILVPPRVDQKIEDVAMKDRTTGSRVVYTALLNYMIKLGLKKPPGSGAL